MALFKIELRLKPSPEGEQQLAEWPQKDFSPDFIVAASGLARFELESKVIGVTADGNQPVATTTDHLNTKQVNYWLPDYIGGLAISLGQAAVQLHTNEQTAMAARFVDEPLELRMEQLPTAEHGKPAQWKISFRYNGESLTDTHVPAVLAVAEIARALQDLVVQLLTVNPALIEQPDVIRLKQQIEQLVKG